MTTRSDVYAAIHDERMYQNKLWDAENHDRNHSIGDWLTFAQVYLDKAKAAYVGHGNSQRAALHEIRKTAALLVACMEYNGVPERGVDYRNTPQEVTPCEH
jgi:hypothetical protein